MLLRRCASALRMKQKPGEVLVSSTVKDLVAGSGINFEDRGVHVLVRVVVSGDCLQFTEASTANMRP